jgi:hypothetical protein
MKGLMCSKITNKCHWWRTVRVPIYIDYWREHWTSPGANNHRTSTMQTWTAPSDFHLFDPLKDALSSGCFASDCELKAVCAWLAAWSKTFFVMAYISLCNIGPVYWKARGLSWRMMHLWVMYCHCVDFNKHIANCRYFLIYPCILLWKFSALTDIINAGTIGRFKKMDSISYCFISWTIHHIWMTYITFEKGGSKVSNTIATALALRTAVQQRQLRANWLLCSTRFFALVNSLDLSQRLWCSVRFIFVSTLNL